VTFCGLKLRIYNPPPQIPILYTISPHSLDQEILDKLVQEFNQQHNQSKAASPTVTLIGEFDEAASNEIKQLLNERNRWAPKPYGWKITAIIPLNDPKRTREILSMRKSTKSQTSKWLIVLQGGFIDVAEAQVVDLPDRFSNPWQDLVPRTSDAIHPDEETYRVRLEEDLKRSGMDERQIAAVLRKERPNDPNQPTYTRMSRRHLSVETLNRYRIDYEFDRISLFAEFCFSIRTITNRI
jgi:hypothetical protein